MSESEMFLASLRYDLINAVGPRDASQPDWDKYLTVTPEKISFQIFRDADGAVDPVEYVYEKSPEGGSIQRFQSSSRRRLIDHHIASLTWDVGTALVQSPGIASGFRQIWVSVRFSVGGKVKLSGKTREVLIETKIFPTRLNQQLNCRERASDALVDF
ncbi:MAG TPA: hypothetical protein PKM25_05420 [Candidatus Ozemobacteraceae bacterium]|nr:hypothetical protein [Candidatus Ozemobacteraceae bacterium]